MQVIQVRLPQLTLCYRWGHTGWWKTSPKPSTVPSQQASLPMVYPERPTLNTPHTGKRASSWGEPSSCGHSPRHAGRANEQRDRHVRLRGSFHESWRSSFFLTKSEFIFVRYLVLEWGSTGRDFSWGGQLPEWVWEGAGVLSWRTACHRASQNILPRGPLVILRKLKSSFQSPF